MNDLQYKEDMSSLLPRHLFNTDSNNKSWHMYTKFTGKHCILKVVSHFANIVQTKQSLTLCVAGVHKQEMGIRQKARCVDMQYVIPPGGGMYPCKDVGHNETRVLFTSPMGLIRIRHGDDEVLKWRIQVIRDLFYLNITFTSFHSSYNGDHCCRNGLSIQGPEGFKCNLFEENNHIFYGIFCGHRFPFSIYTHGDVMMLIPKVMQFTALRVQYQIQMRESGISYFGDAPVPCTIKDYNEGTYMSTIKQVMESKIRCYYTESYIGKKFQTIARDAQFNMQDLTWKPIFSVDKQRIQLYAFLVLTNKYESLLLKEVSGRHFRHF